ncbi:MAG: DUF1373 domain-containing protein [Crocinitomicaceae bacterium]|nr:DUF1373 domain-containing protein [Crocinitomicaceae bacterium]
MSINKPVLLLCYIIFTFVITGQENLIPNGNFESGNYHGGSDPTNYYSGGNNTGPDNFDDDINDWYTSKPSNLFLAPDSPDWIPPGIVLGDGFCPANNSYYVRSTSKQESIMVQLKNGFKLKKGQTYKFSIKYRHARGMANQSGVRSFQVVFSTSDKGLRTNVHNKWVALDVYDVQSCYWNNKTYYFTVLNENLNNKT